MCVCETHIVRIYKCVGDCLCHQLQDCPFNYFHIVSKKILKHSKNQTKNYLLMIPIIYDYESNYYENNFPNDLLPLKLIKKNLLKLNINTY